MLITGLLIVTPPRSFHAEQIIEQNINVLDTSWKLDLGLRLSRGEIAGRGFVFTYGPLGQCVRAAALLVPPGDLATFLRFHDLPEAWLAALCTWLLLGFWSLPFARRALLFLLWVSLLLPASTTAGIRPMAGLLLVALSGKLLGGLAEGTGRFSSLISWAGTAPLLLLYSFDLGVLTFAALLITAGAVFTATAGLGGKGASALRKAALVCSCGLGAGLLVFVAFPRCRWYLLESLELASGYAATMAVPLGPGDLGLLVTALVGALVVLLYAVREIRRGYRTEPAGRAESLGLLAAACFSLVWIRYGLTRSDRFHCLTAVAPVLFLAAFLLPAYLSAAGFALRLPILAAWTVLLLLPIATLEPWPKRWADFCAFDSQPARIDVQKESIREAAAAARELPHDSLYVWPYETLVNHLSGKRNPAYTVQSYSAHTDHLEEATVERLQSVDDLPVVLLTDSWAVDEVPNLTRTPRIFRYLLENYALAAPPHSAFALLRRQPQAARWCQEPLGDVPHKLVLSAGGPLEIRLDKERSSECRASDLLLLELRASSTPTYGLAKSGALAVRFILENGTSRSCRFLLPQDGASHTVLVSACTLQEPLFLSIFHPQRCWRARERVSRLQITWEPMDLLTRRPEEIALVSVALLRRTGVEVLETSLADQSRAIYWNWCYRNGPRPEVP